MARKLVGDPWRSREASDRLLATILWCTDRLRPILRAFRIDFLAFRELLAVRVLLAQRRVSGQTGAGVVLTLAMMAGLGAMTGMLALDGDASRWVVSSLSFLMLMLALTLFGSLAAILVDPTDIGVVAPHPVDDRTLFGVRLAEVFALVLGLTATFAAGNVLVAVFARPWIAVLVVYPLLALLCALTTLGAVALLFALCLRLAGPAHFQRVTLWVQILGGLGTIVLWQTPRTWYEAQAQSWLSGLEDLRYLWPPFQYAELFALACGEGGRLGPSLAGLLVPVAALLATFALASRYFVAGLQGTLGAPAPRARWSGGAITWIGARLTRGTERAGFELAAALSRREPHLLRSVLSQLMMFQALWLLGVGRDGVDPQTLVPVSAGLLFLVLPILFDQARSTSTPEAKELFTRTPLANAAELLRGSVKALLVQWIGGPALVLFLVQLFLAGPGALPHIVLAFELTFVAVLLYARRMNMPQPFTQPIRLHESVNLARLFLSGLGVAALWAAHFALTQNPLVLAVAISLAACLLAVLWRDLEPLLE